MAIKEPEVTKHGHGQDPWRGFSFGKWMNRVDVNDFITRNITPYHGDDSFLEGPTEATTELWEMISELSRKERENGGVLDVDVHTVSTITSHKPGYLDKDKEKVVGLQTDEPFKRSIQPFGGIRMMKDACEAYGFELPEEMIRIFTEIRKTHNQGVFDAYTPEMRAARRAGIITGLPDAYGRGRIIGDYRRVALYGVDFLIEEKKRESAQLEVDSMTESVIREREELTEQIRALNELKQMAASLRLRYFETGNQCERSFPMAVLRLPGCNQGAKRCSNEPGTRIQLPRYFHRTGSERRHIDRKRSPRTRRPFCHETAYCQVPAYS